LPEVFGPVPLFDVEDGAGFVGVGIFGDDRAALVGLAGFVE
jgi:hypothetical protein